MDREIGVSLEVMSELKEEWESRAGALTSYSLGNRGCEGSTQHRGAARTGRTRHHGLTFKLVSAITTGAMEKTGSSVNINNYNLCLYPGT